MRLVQETSFPYRIEREGKVRVPGIVFAAEVGTFDPVPAPGVERR
jgi:hypothetical protein